MSVRVSANNAAGFQGEFSVLNFLSGSFLGSFSVTRAGIPGVPGISLTSLPGTAIGLMPYASFNGVSVTDSLDVALKSTSQTTGVPASLTWEIEPGDGGPRGGIEWMKVRLAYESDAPVDTTLTSFDIREVEFYPTTSPDESGQFYRTLMVDGSSAVDGDVTNLVLSSNNFGNLTDWQVVGTPTIAQNETGPYGSSNTAWTIEDTDTLSVESIFQDIIGLSPNTSHVFSFFVKEGVTTLASQVSFQSYRLDNFSISWSSGVPVIVGPSVSLVLPVRNIGSGWYRVAFILDGATLGVNTSVRITIAPAHTITNYIGSILIYGAQFEQDLHPNENAALDAFILATAPGYIGHTTSSALTQSDFDYSFHFDNLPSGDYQLVCETKQTFNPNPYVLTSGFSVGSLPYTIIASGLPFFGDNPLEVDFTSRVIDTATGADATSSFEFVHWDFGTERLYGTNTDFYRNPTYIFDRQGFYSPIVTYIGPKSSPRLIMSEVALQYFTYPPYAGTGALGFYGSAGGQAGHFGQQTYDPALQEELSLTNPGILWQKYNIDQEYLILSDQVSKTRSFPRFPGDEILFSEQVFRHTGRAVDDKTALSDTALKHFSKTPPEALSLSEEVSRGLVKAPPEGISLMDEVFTFLSLSLSLRDKLLLQESPLIYSKVAYWKFDDGAGTTLSDELGNSDGTLGGSPATPLWITSGIANGGTALEFDGTDDYVGTVGGSTIFGGPLENLPRGDFSVSAWIKDETAYTLPYSPGLTHFILGPLGITGAPADVGWEIGIDTDTHGATSGRSLDFSIHGWDEGPTAGSTHGTVPISTTDWTHIVAVVRVAGSPIGTAEIKLYINGSEPTYGEHNYETATSTPYLSDGDAVMEFGDSATSIRLPWDGAIDEVTIYNRALSQAEVTKLYNR